MKLGNLLIPFLLFGTLVPGEETEISDFFLPRYQPTDQIIRHTHFVLRYHEGHEQPVWVIYRWTKKAAGQTPPAPHPFAPDPAVKTLTADAKDFEGSGFDLGHFAPPGIFGNDSKNAAQAFLFSNMTPQVPSFRIGLWKQLTEREKFCAKTEGEIYVVTGPVLSSDLLQIGPNRVSIPRLFYKVILDYRKPVIKGIGFVLPNIQSERALSTFVVTIDSVEKITGLDFFPAMEDSLENRVESGKSLEGWGF